ncbi:MAG: TPM domain-containing protein [Hyphomicrobiaceae bacterium]
MLLALMAILAGIASASAQPKFPTLTGRIVDQANLLNAEDRTSILALLREYEAKSSDQIVVVTLPTLQGYPIEDYGYQLGRAWGIGQKDVDNGVLLIVAPNERKVRIEVGRGLEPQLTDLMSGLIIERTILPAFRRGDFSGGILAGVRDIRDTLAGDAQAVKERWSIYRTRQDQADREEAILTFLVFAAFVAFVVWMQYREAKRMRANPHDRKRRGGGIIVAPGGWGGHGSWPSGGGGDSGWSGGGGDFGGGGASGSW